MNKNPNVPEESKTSVDTEESRVEARREFLKTAGKFALYTPPALMMLMHPSTQAIARSGGGGARHPGQKGLDRARSVGGAVGGSAPGPRP